MIVMFKQGLIHLPREKNKCQLPTEGARKSSQPLKGVVGMVPREGTLLGPSAASRVEMRWTQTYHLSLPICGGRGHLLALCEHSRL